MEVNKTNSVIATQAIYNDQGVLLLAQGAELSEKRAQILLQHKLMKPLEQSVGIASSLDARQLFGLMNKFAAGVPALQIITRREDYQKTLRLMCLYYEKFPLLQQNLTVLALRAQRIYYHGIFSALAGLAIAMQLKLPPKDQQAAFIAGLFHDVGFLYLAPELSEKNQDFTHDQWKALQAHPLIAQRFLAMVPDLPKDIGIAIASHHERIDGTGYPHHSFGDELPLISQILAATDTIIFNHMRYGEYGEYAHFMLLAALKLNDNISLESVANATMILCKEAPAPDTTPRQIPSPMELLKRQKMLQGQFTQAKSLAQQLMGQSQMVETRALAAVMGRLAVSIVRSGILQTEQEDWLRYLSDNQAGAPHEEGFSLLEFNVMMDQIYDQLLHLKNIIERVVESIPAREPILKSQVETALENFVLQEA
jgi:hypothetical protein